MYEVSRWIDTNIAQETRVERHTGSCTASSTDIARDGSGSTVTRPQSAALFTGVNASQEVSDLTALFRPHRPSRRFHESTVCWLVGRSPSRPFALLHTTCAVLRTRRFYFGELF